MKKNVKSSYFTHPGAVTGLEQFARSINQPLEPMLARFGLSVAVLNDPQAIVSYSGVCGLLEACAKEWNCPDLGIRLGRMQNLEFLGPVGLVARLTETVGEAIAAVRLNMAVHSNAFYADIDSGDSLSGIPARIHYQPKPGSGSGPQMVELSICRVYQFLSIVSGVSPLKIKRVTLQHSPAGPSDSAALFFGCPVQYNASINAVYFDAKLLTAPTAVRDSAHATMVRIYLDQARLRTDVDILEEAQRLIAQLLSTGRCTREAVAGLLHVHPRTLHR